MEEKEEEEGERRYFKLNVHPPEFYPEPLIIRSEDFPDVSPGDVLELYHEEENFSRLLLEVKPENLYPENKLSKNVPRDVVYVEKSIAETFQLSTFKNIIVNKVEREKVALYLVELQFKDQYMGRSEMWRLKKALVNSVVYINKKISFCKDTIRCTVLEMWNEEEKLACGVVTEDTKVVFRSTTAMVYLFIQMSSEMWHFDMHGDLYFEKAVNGFLYEMFYKWKKTGAAHEVTIVLFSRIFYDAKDKSEFPPHMIPCLQKDYRDRFYEDFYRVVVQNERFEDWFPTLHLLRQTFTDYKELVLNYHQRPGVQIPKAYNSAAAQGNFLETLNISLNTFEKHFINRNLDRTGQQAIVITPGVGIFEVDRDLMVITKQRMIDSGVGSDLLCVGEQPLHAVPLFKMYSKGGQPTGQEDFSMPWWINLSFYTSNKKIGYSSFVPRIKLPPRINKERQKLPKKSCYFPTSVVNSLPPESPFEYDDYDAQVFSMPFNKFFASGSLSRMKSLKKGRKTQFKAEVHKPTSRQNSYDDSYVPTRRDNSKQMATLSVTPCISIPSNLKDSKVMVDIYSTSVGGDTKAYERSTIRGSYDDGYMYPPSAHTLYMPSGRALINPFDPSHVTVKLTSNRRRWTHIFPKGPIGGLGRTSAGEDRGRVHRGVVRDNRKEGRYSPAESTSSVITSTPFKEVAESTLNRIADVSLGLQMEPQQAKHQRHPRNRSTSNSEVKFGTYMWGATGEQTWDATLATGVDWKSITYPACLPITTDYKPDQKTLNAEYYISEYNLSPEEHNSDYLPRSPLAKPPLSTREVFDELISQRLAQNFQIIVKPKVDSVERVDASGMTNSMINNTMATMQRSSLVGPYKKAHAEEVWLSIGKIFHKLTLTGQMINVIRHSPKHPYPNLHYNYRYRFLAPDNDTYEISWVEFNMEKLETYNWNYLDFYVCTRGDQDYYLSENLKYWRYRLYILPLKPLQPFTMSIMRGSPEMRCDIYQQICLEDRVNLAEAFLRFIEACMNKIKRPTTSVEKMTPKGRSYTMSGEFKPPGPIDRAKFRERLGSNRGMERDRDKTLSGPGSRYTERGSTASSVEAAGGSAASVSVAGGSAAGGSVASGSAASGSVTGGSAAGGSVAGGSARELECVKPLTSTNTQFNDSFSDSQDSVFGQPSGSGDYQQTRTQKWRRVFQTPGLKDTEFKLLRRNCSNKDIVESMRSPTSTGLTLLPKQDSLPPTTFVSADAVVWLLEHVEGISTEKRAKEVMTSILEEGLVCHASGHPQHPFVYGFYLYFFVNKERDSGSIYRGDWEAFQADWMEVELDFCRPECEEEDVNLQFLQDDLNQVARDQGTDGFRSSTLDPDIAKKAERPEWGQINYQSKYRPEQAFEFLIKWSVATGAVLADLIRTWASRAQNNQLLMIIPIPGDPFALPSQNSDPIRGPIFVALNTECLREDNHHIFSMFDEKTWAYRLFLFREEILRRFGFIPCVMDPKKQLSSATFSTTHQYIHCTGNMLVLIPTTLQLPHGIQGIKAKDNIKNLDEVLERLETETDNGSLISRHLTGDSIPVMYEEGETGFLWSWNFMLSKKWKNMSVTGATGDIGFMDKMLADFRKFCSNSEGRLKDFWDECWEFKCLEVN